MIETCFDILERNTLFLENIPKYPEARTCVCVRVADFGLPQAGSPEVQNNFGHDSNSEIPLHSDSPSIESEIPLDFLTRSSSSPKFLRTFGLALYQIRKYVSIIIFFFFLCYTQNYIWTIRTLAKVLS